MGGDGISLAFQSEELLPCRTAVPTTDPSTTRSDEPSLAKHSIAELGINHRDDLKPKSSSQSPDCRVHPAISPPKQAPAESLRQRVLPVLKERVGRQLLRPLRSIQFHLASLLDSTWNRCLASLPVAHSRHPPLESSCSVRSHSTCHFRGNVPIPRLTGPTWSDCIRF
jgi:hypothetical protein